MKKKIFGFDLGIASIGWAVVEIDDEHFDEKTGEVKEGSIIKAGVRTFPVAENPKNGESLAKPRREARLKRRTVRRKARRMESIKRLFITNNLISREQLEKGIKAQTGGDVWALRVKALSEKLETIELLRVLIHLAKHRGFKSYRKSAEESDEESGMVLKAIKANKEMLTDNKTLAQIICERTKSGSKKRNTDKNYINSIPRDEIIRELKMIYDFQKQFKIFSETLYNEFSQIAFRYKDIQSVASMVGNCAFEKGEKRAPKEAISSEFFVAYSKINNITIWENGNKRFLNEDERKIIFDLLKKYKEVKYTTIAKAIFGRDMSEDFKRSFVDVDYSKTTKTITKNKGKQDEVSDTKSINPEDARFYSLIGYHKLKAALGDDFLDKYDIPTLDKAVTAIACEKNDASIEKCLQALKIHPDDIEKLKALSSAKFINLSFKALYKLNPYLGDGLKYNEACDKVGYDHASTGEALTESKGRLLGRITEGQETAVPVVNRTVAQFRKLYNAIVRAYGEPDQINIETGKELKKSRKEREEITKKQKENEEKRKQAALNVENFGVTGSGKNILKMRLYEQQNGKCIYSGKMIEIERLFEQGYCEIDHILPYSRSLDNGLSNKVLCLMNENQNKRSQTPFEYIGKDSEKWREFKIRISSMRELDKKKKSNLLNETFAAEEDEFRARNANDNSYISRYIRKYLNDGIDFSASAIDIKDRVQARSGAITDYLRHQWGLVKNRDENDLHHAQDAIVVAFATTKMVQYLSYISGNFENKYFLSRQQGEAWYKGLKKKFKEPYCGFKEDIQKKLSEVFVSRSPRKSATGELHKETIVTINAKKLAKLNDTDCKQAENIIKSGIPIRGGMAGNGDMLRTDVFTKKNSKGKDEFYLVPVYKHQAAKGELPNRAITQGKQEKDWVIINDDFQFKFSLHLDDLISTTKGTETYFGYFKGSDRATSNISMEKHDRSEALKKGIGVKTLDALKKYYVDHLGNYFEIKQEKRLNFKRE